MAPSLDRIRLKVARAKQHIRDFEIACRQFVASDPYKLDTKRDPQTGQLIYYLRHVEETPTDLSLLAGDAIHNLRSALDHLVWQLVIAAGNTPKSNNAFPIHNTRAEYISKSPGQVQGIHQNATDAIEATKPYKGGNDALWRLHRLNNIDKHRFIVTVGTAFKGFDVVANMASHVRRSMLGESGQAFADAVERVQFFVGPKEPVFPLKAGDVLFTDLPESEPNKKMRFVFQIALNEPGIVEREPAVELLHGMADLIGNLLTNFAPLL